MNATEPGQNLSDSDAEELLFLILIAITEYGGYEVTTTIGDFAEDVAMSMNVTTDRADSLLRQIEENLT